LRDGKTVECHLLVRRNGAVIRAVLPVGSSRAQRREPLFELLATIVGLLSFFSVIKNALQHSLKVRRISLYVKATHLFTSFFPAQSLVHRVALLQPLYSENFQMLIQNEHTLCDSLRSLTVPYNFLNHYEM
jgi:hypothetical protein